MANRKDRKSELSGEQKFQLMLMIVDRVSSIVNFALKIAATVTIIWGIVSLAQAFAGKVTEASVNLNVKGEGELWVRLLSGFDKDCAWAWLVAVIFIVYGLFERELRRRKTKYLQDRVVKLEKKIDPERKSSGLTTRGETNPEDKL